MARRGKGWSHSRHEHVRSRKAKVRLSRTYQVVIPRAAREALSLRVGDELLLCKQDRLVIMRKPTNFVRRTRGLHREVWQGTNTYLNDERRDW